MLSSSPARCPRLSRPAFRSGRRGFVGEGSELLQGGVRFRVRRPQSPCSIQVVVGPVVIALFEAEQTQLQMIVEVVGTGRAALLQCGGAVFSLAQIGESLAGSSGLRGTI